MREYHTRLIADVVTGKLDVRETAASLTDDIEAVELLDEYEPDYDTDDAGIKDADEVEA